MDGDTEKHDVQADFVRVVLDQIDNLKRANGLIVPDPVVPNGHIPNKVPPRPVNTSYPDTTIQDLEDIEDSPAIKMNGYGPAGPPISDIGRTVDTYNQINERNGGLFGGPTIRTQRPSRESIRDMYAQVDRYGMDSNM